ncbi:MAG: hypothetical protein ABSF98_07405 [Bryobacteraceae bacterium]
MRCLRRAPLALILLASLAPAAGPPSDDLADLEGRADEVVRVNMNSATLQALSRAIPDNAGEDAPFFQALSGVSGIKVVSLSFHGGGMPPPEDVDVLRASVIPAGWTRFLSSRSTDPEEMVAGYAGPGGLAIIAAEPGEITAVHIEGVFSGSAIPLLSHRFGLPAIGSGDTQPAFATRGEHSTGAAVHPEKLDFKRMVREIEAREGIHHLRIPLLSVASPVARLASGGRARALDLAVFEDAPASFVDAADRALPEGWSRFVEVRDGKESTNIYVGAVDQNMPLLIATWDGDGVLLTVKASLKDLCKAPLAWADAGRHSEE